MTQLKVIKLLHSEGFGFTIGKVYTGRNRNVFGSYDVVDDNGDESALFEGEYEVVDAE